MKKTVTLLLLSLLALGCDSQRSAFTREQYRSAATALFPQQLYQEAVDLYGEYLRSSVIPSDDVPKVLYQMGTIYEENLGDPKAALAKFSLIKALYPQETFDNQLGKRMVACLEAMGRSLDATAARSRLADLNPADTTAMPGGGAVVADLDGRKITLGEIAALVGKLPDAPLERNQLVRQYVAQILVADAARRKGLADKPEVKQKVRAIEDQILAQASLQQELKVPQPSGNDLRYYFEANKARYLKGADSTASFETLAPHVQADWAREKQAAEYQSYVERLLQTAKVRFFEVAGK
jgi:tetratricopeptide (TPR) repeat protein